MDNCHLCTDLASQDPNMIWNQPLFEFPNFVALPSLGALVEGWLLLVPKKHFICMGALPDTFVTEMQEIKNFLCSVVQQSYGSVCVFEHGPSKSNQSVGCGVDHAHLHILPMTFDLGSAVNPFLPEGVRWSEAGIKECQTAFTQGTDYLYLEQPISSGRIAINQRFGSQLFRRAIAAQINFPAQFNWREYPQLHNVSATINKLQSWDAGVFSWKNIPRVAA